MRQLISLLILFGLLFTAAPAPLAESLHAPWDKLLKTHVEDGRVDYLGFKNDEEKLDGYLAALAAVSPETLDRDSRLAFYINAYNSYTVKLILANFTKGQPVKSIKKIGGLFTSPWSIRFADLGGRTISLDAIEHEIIRPQFQDPRVHFAVNCASKGCPPLMDRAYTGESLDQQLDMNTRTFLNTPGNTQFRENTLYVSKIFRWFAEDFNDDIIGFVRHYASTELLDRINAAEASVQVKYLDYDWSLNGK